MESFGAGLAKKMSLKEGDRVQISTIKGDVVRLRCRDISKVVLRNR